MDRQIALGTHADPHSLGPSGCGRRKRIHILQERVFCVCICMFALIPRIIPVFATNGVRGPMDVAALIVGSV
jgi:hypothetical protein